MHNFLTEPIWEPKIRKTVDQMRILALRHRLIKNVVAQRRHRRPMGIEPGPKMVKLFQSEDQEDRKQEDRLISLRHIVKLSATPLEA